MIYYFSNDDVLLLITDHLWFLFLDLDKMIVSKFHLSPTMNG